MAAKVVVGSKNPVKLEAVKKAFAKMMPQLNAVFEAVDAPSNVSDQPMGDDETLLGARNRCENAKKEIPDADYYCGCEGGCERVGEGMVCFAWMVVRGRDKREGKAKTSMFDLPPDVVALVNDGMELGHANDKVFSTLESKKGSGAVGLLTNGVVNRTEYYEQAIVLALIPHVMKQLYP